MYYMFGNNIMLRKKTLIKVPVFCCISMLVSNKRYNTCYLFPVTNFKDQYLVSFNVYKILGFFLIDLTF